MSGVHRFDPGRKYCVLPLLAILLPLLPACVLDRSGELGCPEEEEISCNVFDVSYSFTPAEHNYVFKGSCTLIEEKGHSELKDPEAGE